MQRGTQMMVRKVHECLMVQLLTGLMAVWVVLGVLPSFPALAADAVVQKTFASPRQAVAALIDALQEDSVAELLAIFGADAEGLISSGDPVADQNGRSRFLSAYEEKYHLEQESEGRMMFLVGSNEYPFPIPIVLRDGVWFFDTREGMEEILNRRIGRNELHTIEVMRVYTDAQREYACGKSNGCVSEFAQKLSSSDGKKDGLYWDAGEGEEESPFGPLIARATEMGYAGRLDEDPPEPYQGYFFKILKRQGENAVGGAFDYVVDGKMILGFGLVAYPARYGASGIMTFIVNQEGVIYEQDLGEETSRVAAAMSSFDPDGSWRKYEEPGEP